jgi:glycerol-3-phosphate dehydrogenase
VAWDAALRGLSVALVERDDFASQTSANSLKVVHGGLRYLQRLDVPRLRASVRERSFWLRSAPHLVEPLPIVVPLYGGGAPLRALMRAGLLVNDGIGFDRNRGLCEERRLPPGRVVSRAECLDLAPVLDGRGLSGGVLFHDAQMYSAERLVLAVVRAACEAGAVVANHVEAAGPAIAAGGGVRLGAHDRLRGEGFDLRARLVVNATGPGTARLVQTLLGATPTALPAYSEAVNFVLPGREQRAAVAFRDRGRRGPVLFAVPWRGETLIGTGHYPHRGPTSPFTLAPEAAERFLAEVNRSWPGDPIRTDEIRLTHGGLLPAAATTRGGVRLLTRHRIADHAREGAPFLISGLSVKFTTARRVAQELVDMTFRKLGQSPPPCRTLSARLPGAFSGTLAELRREAEARSAGTIPADVLDHLVRSYGAEYHEVLAWRERVAAWDERLAPEAPVIAAQMHHATAAEMACRSEDLLCRRTELGARGFRSAALTAAAERILASASGEAPAHTGG